MNLIRGCIINVSSYFDLIDGILQTKDMDFIDVISREVIERNVNNIGKKKLRVGLLQMLCSEKFFEGEANKENKEANVTGSKKTISHDEKNLFKMKNGFN